MIRAKSPKGEHHDPHPALLSRSSAVALAILGEGGLPRPPSRRRCPVARPRPRALAAAPADKPDPTLTLKIGDPALKDKVMEIGAGDVLSGRTGRPVGFDRMIDEMMAARIVHVGETHNSMPMHEIEYQAIRALYARDRGIWPSASRWCR